MYNVFIYFATSPKKIYNHQMGEMMMQTIVSHTTHKKNAVQMFYDRISPATAKNHTVKYISLGIIACNLCAQELADLAAATSDKWCALSVYSVSVYARALTRRVTRDTVLERTRELAGRLSIRGRLARHDLRSY